MDQLSSCYFCGGALDVSLSEYPIIPKSLDPEAEKQGTVVLCSTCREKLATIVEPAVEAAKADARETAEAATDTGTAEPPGLLDDSETQTSDEPTTADSVVEPADDGSLLGDDSAGTNGQSASERSAATADSTPEPEATDSDETDTATDPVDERAAESTSERDTGTAGAETGANDAESSDTSDGSADGPSLTKLEYNKVMRLLQNREMPVDRAEIREVAVNAYDIDGEQFDAIIDAAVDRDLIGQENGQLVESDG
ncbi:hypothetical protein NDI54_04550 [Haloarcula sp. S1AR25-5A]|uniref:Uncharacterized protein n=1 Tax=Haloarcula terrestris TaxID=2950533 RepID=A0AAE4EW85_9EURY|nr:hypothetical protein [Haloarcula terrestris]MDS0220619.1 hypothetical protein [Haloarcula terrestris]